MSQNSTNSLKIIFDTTLEKKEIKEFEHLANKLELDLTTPDKHFAEFEHNNIIISKQTDSNFVNAFLNSYNNHLTIKIRPDDIKLQILLTVSTCINNNPEEYRSFFVDHTGKKELVLKNDFFDANYFCQTFGKLLEQNIKDPNFAQHYRSEFSTTNRIIKNVNNIILMNTLKEYFSCTMMLGCGIPSIVLNGSQEDWCELFKTYCYFKSILLNSELKDWFKHFDVVMNLFLDMRNLAQNGEIEGTHYMKEMMKRIITYIPQGSGGQIFLGGWIRLFCPYNSSNKVIMNLDKDIPCLDLSSSEPSMGFRAGSQTSEPSMGIRAGLTKTSEPSKSNIKDYYGWQDEMKKFYNGCDWSQISTSRIITPAKLINYDSTEHQVEFYSGFFEPHLNDNGEICMNIGYLMRKNTEYAKNIMKQEYINKGVIDVGFGTIKIPESLKNDCVDIMMCFNAYSSVYYDPETYGETLKLQKYYKENGVSLINSFTVNIPKKFEEKVDEIMSIFECFRSRMY
jgi:hypothetical protein